MVSQNELAQQFKKLHVPGKPIILTNVFDIISAEAIVALPAAKALATASYGVAKVNGMDDNDMDMETNLKTIAAIAKVVTPSGKPLTCDIQDGYGEQLEETIKRIIALGAVGCNLEDVNQRVSPAKQYSEEEAVSRVKRALAAAKEAGVPDFVVNARCDTLLFTGDMDEVVRRGKAYLEAGATTVFVWGAARGTRTEEVVRMVKEFNGRLNVSMRVGVEGKLTAPELSKIGVARISIGPQLQLLAMKHLSDVANGILTSV